MACQGWNMWIDSAAQACVFHSLESLLEVARDIGTRGHRFKLAIPVCRSEVRRRSFVVMCGTHCRLGLLKRVVSSALKGDWMSY